MNLSYQEMKKLIKNVWFSYLRFWFWVQGLRLWTFELETELWFQVDCRNELWFRVKDLHWFGDSGFCILPFIFHQFPICFKFLQFSHFSNTGSVLVYFWLFTIQFGSRTVGKIQVRFTNQINGLVILTSVRLNLMVWFGLLIFWIVLLATTPWSWHKGYQRSQHYHNNHKGS